MKGFNKARLRAFIQRRKINAMGLLMITFVCALITVVCAIQGFSRTSILSVITILLVVLCFIQEIKLRKGYRTIKSFKGSRKKKNA
ncbi:MAG: hypothetical protein IJ337_05385 [Clostridia bacterium]|nr:hypothetical protein [Clostridia bacterium]